MYETVKVESKFLYRYRDSHVEISYCFGYSTKATPVLEQYKIVRETAKSYFFYNWCDEVKRVPKDGRNLFAWDTEEKALYNYLKRKEAQIRILTFKLDKANMYLSWIKNKNNGKEVNEVLNPMLQGIFSII